MTLASFLSDIRRFTNVPILVLGHQGAEVGVVAALELGADAYVPLPCNLAELMARVRALLRRSYNTHHNAESPLTIGGLTINPSTYEVFLHHRRIKLSVTEFRLLCLLAKNPGDVVPHHTIQQALRADHSKSAGLVKKYIQRLRRKLGDNPRAPVWIASVHGVGYRFIGHDPVSPPLASRVQQ